jgi:hypothetical protein
MPDRVRMDLWGDPSRVVDKDKMTDATRAELLREITRSARRLGANSELLGLIGSWGNGLSGEDLLAALRKWNSAHPISPDEPAKVTTVVEAALATLSGCATTAGGTTLENSIQKEICLAFKRLGGPIELMAVLSSWGDIYDDARTLDDLRRFNQSGSIFDRVTHDLGVLGQDNGSDGPKHDR